MQIVQFPDLLKCVEINKSPVYLKALAIGLALDLLAARHPKESFGNLLYRIIPAVEKGQFEIFFDSSGRCLGYVSWAMVSDLKSRQFMQTGVVHLANNEWCGGENLWIVDFVGKRHCAQPFLETLRDRVLINSHALTYIRKKNGNAIIKSVTRADRSHFFTAHRNKKIHSIQANEMVACGFKFQAEEAQEIGRLACVLHATERNLNTPSSLLLYQLREIVSLRQYRIYDSKDGLPSGLLTWHWISARTFLRRGVTPLHRIHVSEWNEGKHLLFRDIVASDEVKPSVRRDIISGLLPEATTAWLYLVSRYTRETQLIKIHRNVSDDRALDWESNASSQYSTFSIDSEGVAL